MTIFYNLTLICQLKSQLTASLQILLTVASENELICDETLIFFKLFVKI